jgi:hypothetical protein
MLFIGHYRILPGNRDACIARFAQTAASPRKASS